MDILHIIYRLDVGGMENGLVNLVNRLDSERFHHKILCLTGATESRQFDFFVQPSLNEGISNTVLEAMASGLTVIATAVGGNPELIRNNKEGQLVKAGDVLELRDALEEYATRASVRQERGRAARNRAVTCFSVDAMIKNYANLYDGCVAGLRKAAA